MKTIISDANDLNTRAARKIKALLDEKPDAVLAFAAGRSMTGLFVCLRELCTAGELSFKNAAIFAVTELVGVSEEHMHRSKLNEQLVSGIDIKPENVHYLTENELEKYDAAISAAGGLDLAVLGIGDNGHFGYNEPGTQFDTYTHLQTLAPATRRQLAPAFGGEDKTPEKALTMGIKTITQAHDIMVLVTGAEKAEAAFEMLYARNDSVIPAAFLQIPLNVTVYVDDAAAAKL